MVEKVEFMNMCMVYEQDRVLVIERKKKDWAGITFPGGHVEEGESFTDAVIREIKEETGLTIQPPELCGIKNWYKDGKRCVVLLYRTSKFEGSLQSSEEGKVWWEDISNLPNLDLAMDMREMIRVFTEDHLSEFFYRIDCGRWIPELR